MDTVVSLNKLLLCAADDAVNKVLDLSPALSALVTVSLSRGISARKEQRLGDRLILAQRRHGNWPVFVVAYLKID